MKTTTRTISVTDLKARLSEQLRAVKAGEKLIVTERGRPIAMMAPLRKEALDTEFADLVDAGLIRLAERSLDPDFWKQARPDDPEGSVRQALLEEREEGR